MSTVTGQNFSMYQGESCRPTVAVVDGNGDPASLTGATAVWAMQRGASRLQKAASIDGSTVTVELEPEDTGSLVAADYIHHLQVTDGDGDVVIVTAGKVTLKQRIIIE